MRRLLDNRTVDLLTAKHPDLAQDVAIAIGEARLRAGMSMMPLAAFAANQIAEPGAAVAPLPNYDLDAELRSIRETARELVGSTL